MEDKKNRLIVGITTGDPNGIGIELILKTFQDDRMLEICTPVIFGSVGLISTYAKQLNIKNHFFEAKNLLSIRHGKINLLDVCKTNLQLNLGKEDPLAGTYAVESLSSAVKALKNKDINTLVTAPINKKICQSNEFRFNGHTEYVEDKLQGMGLMFMISDNIKIALLTNHTPLKDIVSHITPKIINSKIQILNKSLIQDFNISRPKIAVLSLNPHVGDGGLIGDEDEKIMIPAINKLFNEGKLVFGPYAADGFFGSQMYNKFDAIVATYHDQGLIPFKTLTFGQGVNFTAGLNRIRTSPDHGTAYDIAGKSLAEFSSFRESIYKGIDIYRRRNDYLELKQGIIIDDVKDKTFPK